MPPFVPVAAGMTTVATAADAGGPQMGSVAAENGSAGGLAGGADVFTSPNSAEGRAPDIGARHGGGWRQGGIRGLLDRIRRPKKPRGPVTSDPESGPKTAAAYLRSETINYEGKDLVFYDLLSYVGTITAGLRADTDPQKRVGMPQRFAGILERDGIEQLYDALISVGVNPTSARLDDSIFQTDDENRSIVEIASNSVDASRADVKIVLKDGFYEILDSGKGMDASVIVERLLVPKLSGKPDPSQQNGRFGIGFMTVLRHLKNEGEYVEVFTQSQDGHAHEIVYLMRNGRMKIGARKARPSEAGGTRIRVASAGIKKKEMDAEITKYLRYVNDGRNVYVNNECRSHFDFPHVDGLSRPGDYGRIFVNPDYRNSVTVKIGELIYESYETGGAALPGDIIIELPYSAKYSPTRDFAAVDEALYEYMQTLIGRAKTLEDLNTLAPLLEKMDERHEHDPLMKAARMRAAEIMKSEYKGRRIYPDREAIRNRVEAAGEILFIHPGLYCAELLDRFETPREFMSGEVISAGGWKRPMSLVLSPDIATPLCLDADSGVLYLNEAIYRERPEFVLSAVFMVPGMEFNVRWSSGAIAAGGMEMFAKRGERTVVPSPAGVVSKDAPVIPEAREKGDKVEPKPPAGQRDEKDRPNLGAIAEFLEERGILLADFARKIPEGYEFYSRETQGERDYVVLENTDSEAKNIMDIETGRLLLGTDANQAGAFNFGNFILAVYDETQILFHPDGTLLARGVVIEHHIDPNSSKIEIRENAAVFDKEGKEIANGDRIDIFITGRRRWYSVTDDGNPGAVSRVLREDGTHFADGYLVGVRNIDGEDLLVIQGDGEDHLTDERGTVILSGLHVDAKSAGGKTFYYREDMTGRAQWMRKDGTVVFEGGATLKEAGGKVWFLHVGGWRNVYDANGELFLEGDMATMTEIFDTADGARFVITENGRRRLLREDKTVVAEGKQIDTLGCGNGIVLFRVLDDEGRQRLVRPDGKEIARGESVIVQQTDEGASYWVRFTEGTRTRTFKVKAEILRVGGDDADFFGKGPLWAIAEEGRMQWIGGVKVDAHGVDIIRDPSDERKFSIPPEFYMRNLVHNFNHVSGRREWLRDDYFGKRVVRLASIDGKHSFVAEAIINAKDAHSAVFAMRISERKHVLLDEDGRILLRGEKIWMDEIDGTVFVSVFNRGVWRTYVKVGDRLSLAGENNSLSYMDDEFVNNYASLLPLDDLNKLAASPSSDARLDEVRRRRLSIRDISYALMHADDDLWGAFIGSREKRELLTLMKSPQQLAFAKEHADDDLIALKKALIVMGHLPPLIGTDDELYMERVARLMDSGLDIDALVSDITAGRESEDILAVRHFLRDRDVVGIGRPSIARPNTKARKLSDIVTHIRLNGKSTGIDGAKRASRYDCEVDRRELNHAITHLNAANPHNYQKQLLQNSLDIQNVPGRVAEGEHRIEVDTFMDGPDFILRMRDFGGMTEDEVMDLLKPGDGTKAGAFFRGGYGEGFFSTMADAKWVRVKTAIKGSKDVMIIDFEVLRGADGKISDILARMEKVKNSENFHGTIVETARHSRSPLLEASRVRTRMRDMGQYVSNSEASIIVDGDHANEGRNGPLVETESKTIGSVALYDGLANRILLGNLPLMDLPDELWAAVPDGVKDYFRRKGFYIDLDHTRLRPAPTWDRLQNHAEVMAELKSILPALLIRGFLMRVAGADRGDDLKDLPEVYFVEAYKLAEREAIGRGTIKDAEIINRGDFNVDASKYFGEEGRQNLIKLMTVIKFVSVAGFEEPLSLADIHEIYLDAMADNEDAKANLAKVLAANLPQGIRERLHIAERVADSGRAGKARVEKDSAAEGGIVKHLAPDRTYEMGEVTSEDHRRYLSLVEKVSGVVWRHFGGGTVRIGINTRKDHAAFFAYHKASRGRYNLYRSYGAALDADAAELADIIQTSGPEIALARFERYLARLYEVITHEITHVAREHPNTFTHAPKFYADQMDLMLEPPIDAEQVQEWMEELKG